MTNKTNFSTRKIILSLLSISSLALLSWQAYTFYSSPLASYFIDREVSEIKHRVQLQLLESATPEHIAQRLQSALEPVPADWEGIDLLREFSAENNVVLTQSLLNQINARETVERGEDDSFATACYRCMKDSDSCPISLATSCDLAVELTPVGDVRSISTAFTDWLADRPVDTFETGLATVGLAASVGSIFTAGTTYSIKVGTSTIKVARRIGSIGKPLARFLRRNTEGLLDFSRIPKNWRKDPSSIMGAISVTKLSELKSLLLNLGGIRANVGTTKTLRILRTIDGGTDAHRMRLASDIFKADTPKALEVLGKNRLLKQTYKINPKITRMAGTLLTLCAALLGLFWGALSVLLSTIFRYFLRVTKRRLNSPATVVDA